MVLHIIHTVRTPSLRLIMSPSLGLKPKPKRKPNDNPISPPYWKIQKYNALMMNSLANDAEVSLMP